jgi:hypothetical protein
MRFQEAYKGWQESCRNRHCPSASPWFARNGWKIAAPRPSLSSTSTWSSRCPRHVDEGRTSPGADDRRGLEGKSQR